MGNFFGPDMLLRIPALLIAITFHEFAHARVSSSLGDPTPKWSGRLSLNPLAHLDPIGLLMLWIFKFGWAKPVEINPMYYKDPKKGIILVSLAGPLTNLLLALLSLIILKLNLFSNWIFESFIYILFLYNIVLAVFNLIPIPPLDGSKILIGLLPSRRTYVFHKLEAYGPIILIILAYLGILNTIMSPLITFVHAGLDTISNLVLFRF
ncbi:MAG TPA: site-2 protease family protein [Thermoanaerobacterales bacterium]|jgi:Zn-dependent protease|nr:site-2 protease family protein [Thermoanaerobacterales bacterium]